MMDINAIKEELEKEFSLSEKDQDFFIDLPLLYSFLGDSKKLLTLDYTKKDYTGDDIGELLFKIRKKLRLLLSEEGFPKEKAEEKTDHLLTRLPSIRRLLYGSMKAILTGDPASDSIEEIVTCYPGFQAILNYRIAHELYLSQVHFLARVITEDAHRSTGIDINPGATIGENFFIDHGTGIVIGETAKIGNNVKLYQGVTLGAKSLSKGKALSGKKRHPTVEDNVTIYSNASILGGDTVIGKNTTIGANVYLTKSIPANSLVLLTDCGIRVTPKKE